MVSGKKALDGLKVAYGPQLWWGANPALFLKYTRAFGDYELTFVDQEQVGVNTRAQHLVGRARSSSSARRRSP